MSNNWNGNGLPEIGAECEYKYTHDGLYWKCRIMGYNGNSVAFTREDHSDSIFVSTIKAAEFRPIKSDRDKAVEDMVRLYHESPSVDIKECFGFIYDAGYRKTNSGE